MSVCVKSSGKKVARSKPDLHVSQVCDNRCAKLHANNSPECKMINLAIPGDLSMKHALFMAILNLNLNSVINWLFHKTCHYGNITIVLFSKIQSQCILYSNAMLITHSVIITIKNLVTNLVNNVDYYYYFILLFWCTSQLRKTYLKIYL